MSFARIVTPFGTLSPRKLLLCIWVPVVAAPSIRIPPYVVVTKLAGATPFPPKQLFVAVAPVASFLASEDARYLTGNTLFVDGGTQAAFGFLDWPGGDGFMPAPLGGALKMMFG